MKKIAQRGLLALFVIGFTGLGAIAQDGAKIYLRGMKSCVLVYNIDSRGLGSGSLVNLRDGYVITNWHVVREGTKMFVVFPMWEKERPVVETEKYKSQIRKIGVPGEVVAFDEKVDLAVIKFDPTRIPKGSEAIRFATESPPVGSKIYSIGNPGASDAMWIYTPGEVRQVYKKQWKSGSMGKLIGDHDAKIIEATSLTNPGDSGGPCFNERGEQVGVTQGGLSAKFGQGFSYFIDASEVRTFLKSKKINFHQAGAPVEVAMEKKDPKTEVAKTDVPAKVDPKIDTAAEERAKQEKSAANMLNLLRPLAKDPGRQKFAAPKLRDLIKMYPMTEAAKEAQELLTSIQ